MASAKTRLGVRLGLLAALAALVGMAMQFRPVLIYHLTLVPELEAMGLAGSIDAPTFDRFDTPPDDWPHLVAANFQLRAPILGVDDGNPCHACGTECLLKVAGGTLGIFGAPPDENLADALDRFASRGSDIGVWRSRSRNWATLEAVASRSLNPGLPESFRFRAPGSQGMVTVHDGSNGERFVIYSYGPGGTPTRVIGLALVPRATLMKVLGSLVITDGRSPAAPASCSPWTDESLPVKSPA